MAERSAWMWRPAQSWQIISTNQSRKSKLLKSSGVWCGARPNDWRQIHNHPSPLPLQIPRRLAIHMSQPFRSRKGVILLMNVAIRQKQYLTANSNLQIISRCNMYLRNMCWIILSRLPTCMLSFTARVNELSSSKSWLSLEKKASRNLQFLNGIRFE